MKTIQVTLNDEQIKELLLACECVSWENEDFTSAVQALEDALKELEV